MIYIYGMRMRGYSPGCQPLKGLIDLRSDKTGKYYDILYYDRKLTANEVYMYELDELEVKDDNSNYRTEH